MLIFFENWISVLTKKIENVCRITSWFLNIVSSKRPLFLIVHVICLWRKNRAQNIATCLYENKHSAPKNITRTIEVESTEIPVTTKSIFLSLKSFKYIALVNRTNNSWKFFTLSNYHNFQMCELSGLFLSLRNSKDTEIPEKNWNISEH